MYVCCMSELDDVDVCFLDVLVCCFFVFVCIWDDCSVVIEYEGCVVFVVCIDWVFLVFWW